MDNINVQPESDSHLLTRVLLTCALEFPFLALLLFGGAGTLAWTAGWVWLAIMALISLPMVVFLYKYNPDLLRERLKSPIQQAQKGWDKIVLPIFLGLFLVWMVLMPLDAVRYHWSSLPASLALPGAAVVLVSSLFMSWCFVENSYLAPVVKIQSERGHHVISSGPYAFVRHPMYLGALCFFVGTPLLFGSYWGLIVAAVLCGVLAIRTALEDRTLQEELPGYKDYSKKVRFRLLPGIW